MDSNEWRNLTGSQGAKLLSDSQILSWFASANYNELGNHIQSQLKLRGIGANQWKGFTGTQAQKAVQESGGFGGMDWGDIPVPVRRMLSAKHSEKFSERKPGIVRPRI